MKARQYVTAETLTVGEEAIDKKPRDTTEALAITAEVTPS